MLLGQVACSDGDTTNIAATPTPTPKPTPTGDEMDFVIDDSQRKDARDAVFKYLVFQAIQRTD